MPRALDLDKRREEIFEISIRILETEGPQALTLRAIANKLGGSITLVTHIYPTRRELLTALGEGLIQQYEAELPVLGAKAEASERLWILLNWMLPLTQADWQMERGRLLLLADMDTQTAQTFSSRIDTTMRDIIRRHLVDIVPADEVDSYVDVLRALTDGITLAAVEHPAKWPADRQVATLRFGLTRLGLHQNTSDTTVTKVSA